MGARRAGDTAMTIATPTEAAEKAQAARVASRALGFASTVAKDAALTGIASALLLEQGALLELNAAEVERARARGIDPAFVDRMTLTPARVAAMAQTARDVAALPDPVGQMEDVRARPNGMQVGRMRVPLGVIGAVYESRPNVTVDMAALCLKSGNAVVLRSGTDAHASSQALARIAPEDVLTFAGERADLALQLSHRLAPKLVSEQLDDVFLQIEMPLVPVLAQIERAGIRVDRSSLAAQSQHLEGKLARLTARIFELAGQEFNVNSPKQLGEILFDKLQLPTLKKTGKTRSASTSVDVLEELARVHELPRLVLEWRGLHKLKSTYVDALPALVHPDTTRLHTSFNQAVAATGRLSSSDPNLQNIPIRTALGRQIRGAFVAAPDNVLISADYSQIELRVLAHLAEEEALIEAFRAGEDIHDRTAVSVFGADSGLDAHELRRRAKIINYALLYGKTAFTLAKDIGVTNDAAQTFIDAYFAGFPKVRGFIDSTLAQARETGVVKTLFGRRRLVPELNSRNGQVRAAAERVAVNMPIQGTAADILKKAMIDLYRELPAQGFATRMILTVHDELLFEGPKTEAESAVALVRERMEGVASLAVPLTVDVGFADNWRDAKP